MVTAEAASHFGLKAGWALDFVTPRVLSIMAASGASIRRGS